MSVLFYFNFLELRFQRDNLCCVSFNITRSETNTTTRGASLHFCRGREKGCYSFVYLQLTCKFHCSVISGHSQVLILSRLEYTGLGCGCPNSKHMMWFKTQNPPSLFALSCVVRNLQLYLQTWRTSDCFCKCTSLKFCRCFCKSARN